MARLCAGSAAALFAMAVQASWASGGELGAPGDDADRGVRAAGQREQVADLARHGLGVFRRDVEGALVDDRFDEPGHAGGPVRLAV